MSLQGEMLRSECASLLFAMPEKALSEVLEFMKEANSFYSVRPIKQETIKIESVRATLGKMVTRPEFPISEQENF
jgi:hypothetical protein